MTNKIPKHSQESSRKGNVPKNEVSVLSTHPDTHNKIPQEKREGFIHWLGNPKVKSQIEFDFKFSFYFIMILLCFLSIVWLIIKAVQIIIK